MGELTFNEEEKYKGVPSYYRERSELVNWLYKLGFGKKIAAQSLIMIAVIAILLSFLVMYNLVTSNFSPTEVPEVRIEQTESV